ncbi:MAG: rhomboid family intramembrane serine protease [Prevotellaceae bacterium]|jgi:membrane associated rhomboid family serine protease|nr:rhomboid family intramembrane serine protease [Prevotellaceae bacterium]
MSIKDEIQHSFKEGTTLTKLIYINLGVFLVIGLAATILELFKINPEWTNVVMLPADLTTLLHTPWTIISYMFAHTGFIHLLFNILMLYWFGKLFLSFFSQKDLVGLYLIGGISGGIFYILSYHIFPLFADKIHGSYLLGASASVLSIIVAVAVTAPDYPVRLLFFGEVRLKWIAIIGVILSLLNVSSSNAGGEIAHLGGAVAGYLFAASYKKGSNITAWINRILDKFFDLFKRKPKLKITHQRPANDHEYNLRKKQENDNIDRILEKIKRGGYESLSKEEKQDLFRASQK